MTALAERITLRCEHCNLVQFMTASTLCRRCHKSIALVVEPKPVPAPAPRLVVPTAPEDFSHIGATVREIRLARKLTQRQLATRMGVPRTYISKIEGGRATPTVASLDRFAKGLGVDIATLLREPEHRLMSDPFIAEIAPYIAQLDEHQRYFILNALRTLAAQK